MIKTVDDYVSKVKEQWPTISESDIKKMIEYGWRMIYYYTAYECDICISSKKYKTWMHIGRLPYDAIEKYNKYRKKLKLRLRVLYKNKKRVWDGYSYVLLFQKDYERVKKLLEEHPGEPIEFENRRAYALFDEARLAEKNSKCIVKCRIDGKKFLFRQFLRKFTARECEIVWVRDHIEKFHEIMFSLNKFKI